MELSLQGAVIGASRDRIFIRPQQGEDIIIKLDEAEDLMFGLQDAIQTADHLDEPNAGGVFEAVENLIAACEQPAA